ncbi:hypothetical protein SCLCIDRAFT_1128781 [Scleroderma citrinum Foug A]|uniref:Uncharacterized protein n=1 Tax=Scleroderma citrinum Foug A TaxID=1036808 RepID=A0A0C2ZYV2_9AGAM|nr:hypothetical protein SCLCIDRAFT_1128781 [Scleroderma citrinum Foug A]
MQHGTKMKIAGEPPWASPNLICLCVWQRQASRGSAVPTRRFSAQLLSTACIPHALMSIKVYSSRTSRRLRTYSTVLEQVSASTLSTVLDDSGTARVSYLLLQIATSQTRPVY